MEEKFADQAKQIESLSSLVASLQKDNNKLTRQLVASSEAADAKTKLIKTLEDELKDATAKCEPLEEKLHVLQSENDALQSDNRSLRDQLLSELRRQEEETSEEWEVDERLLEEKSPHSHPTASLSAEPSSKLSITELKATIENLSQKLASKDSLYERIKEEATVLRSELQNTNSVWASQLEGAQQSLKESTEKLAEFQLSISKLKEENGVLTELNNDYATSALEMRQNFAALRAKYDADLAVSQSKVSELESAEKTDYTAALTAKESEFSAKVEELLKSQAEVESLKTELARLRVQLRSALCTQHTGNGESQSLCPNLASPSLPAASQQAPSSALAPATLSTSAPEFHPENQAVLAGNSVQNSTVTPVSIPTFPPVVGGEQQVSPAITAPSRVQRNFQLSLAMYDDKMSLPNWLRLVETQFALEGVVDGCVQANALMQKLSPKLISALELFFATKESAYNPNFAELKEFLLLNCAPTFSVQAAEKALQRCHENRQNKNPLFSFKEELKICELQLVRARLADNPHPGLEKSAQASVIQQQVAKEVCSQFLRGLDEPFRGIINSAAGAPAWKVAISSEASLEKIYSLVEEIIQVETARKSGTTQSIPNSDKHGPRNGGKSGNFRGRNGNNSRGFPGRNLAKTEPKSCPKHPQFSNHTWEECFQNPDNPNSKKNFLGNQGKSESGQSSATKHRMLHFAKEQATRVQTAQISSNQSNSPFRAQTTLGYAPRLNHVTVNGFPVYPLPDTGAESSLISRAYFESLVALNALDPARVKPVQFRVHGATPGESQIKQAIPVKIRYKRCRPCFVDLLIYDDLPAEVKLLFGVNVLPFLHPSAVECIYGLPISNPLASVCKQANLSRDGYICPDGAGVLERGRRASGP